MKTSFRMAMATTTALVVGIAIGAYAPHYLNPASAAEQAPARKKLVPERLFLEWKLDGAHKETPAEMKTMLAYQAKMETDGTKFIGGARYDEAGKRAGGLLLIRAKSWDAARRILNADPGVKDGSTKYELYEFSLNSGAFDVRLAFGDANKTHFVAGSPAPEE